MRNRVLVAEKIVFGDFSSIDRQNGLSTPQNLAKNKENMLIESHQPISSFSNYV